MLRKLKLTAGQMLRQRAVSDRVTRIDAEKQAATACLQRELKCYKEQDAPRSTAVFFEGNGGNENNRACSNGSGSDGSSLKEPERKCSIKAQ